MIVLYQKHNDDLVLRAACARERPLWKFTGVSGNRSVWATGDLIITGVFGTHQFLPDFTGDG